MNLPCEDPRRSTPAVTAAHHAPADYFFIVGCQRSGTTLMRLILECHSRIQCCDESSAYNVLRHVETPRAERPRLGLKVPCITEQLLNRVLWDYYLIRDAIRNEYCGQPIVFMTRDARDTVSSMQRLRIHGEPWNGAAWTDGYLTPSLRSKTVNEAPFRTRYADDLARLRRAKHVGLARAAFYWRYKCEALLDYVNAGLPVLLVRYEDLVAHPARELLRVCGFLRIPWEPSLLAHHTEAHGDVEHGGLAIGGTDPSRPIDGLSIGRWRTDFDDEQLDEMTAFAGEMQQMLYGAAAGETNDG